MDNRRRIIADRYRQPFFYPLPACYSIAKRVSREDSMDILIQGGTVVTPSAKEKKDIYIKNEKIYEIGENLKDKGGSFDEVIDATGKYVFPGIVDAHTHYHLESRGTVTADGFYTGSIAGAFGGVTTAIDFADQIEGKSLAVATEERKDHADSEIVIDYGLHQSVYTVYDDIAEEIAEMKKNGVTTIKIFTTYKREGYFIEEESMRKLFKACRDAEVMVTVHCEDDDIIEEREREYENSPHPPSLHPILRPDESEYRAIKTIGEIARTEDMPLYIVHLSSKRGYDAVKELRSAGAKIFVETTPHYLLLTNDLLSREDGHKYLMTPPLREKGDNEALWKGIEAGDIETIATDHCTFTPEQKFSSDDCRTILPGVPGTEELLPLSYTYGVGEGHIDEKRLVYLLSECPAKTFGIYPRKGSLEVGTDADIVIFDPEKETIITDESRHSAAGYSPYSGRKVRGLPVMTILRGKVIVRDGELNAEKGGGRFVEAGSSQLYTSTPV